MALHAPESAEARCFVHVDVHRRFARGRAGRLRRRLYGRHRRLYGSGLHGRSGRRSGKGGNGAAGDEPLPRFGRDVVAVKVMLVFDGRGLRRRFNRRSRRIRYNLFRAVGIGDIALRLVLILLRIAGRSGRFLFLHGSGFRRLGRRRFRARFALMPLAQRRGFAAEIVLVLLRRNTAAAAAVEIGIFVEDAVLRIAAARGRRRRGGRTRRGARRRGKAAPAHVRLVPIGRGRIGIVYVRGKAVHVRGCWPVAVQNRVPLRVGRKGLLLNGLLGGAALFLRPAALLPHFAAGLEVEFIPHRKQPLGAVDGVGFSGSGLRSRLRLRRLVRRLVRRLHRPLLCRIRRLAARRRVIPIVCAGSVGGGVVHRSTRGRALFFALFEHAALGRIQEICRADDEKGEDNISADCRRQLDDGIHDKPEDNAAGGREGVFAPLLSARTRAVAGGKIFAVAAVLDASGGRRNRMHEADEEHKEQHAQPGRLAGNGELFAGNKHEAEIDERRKERIGAIAEGSEQESAYGKAHAAENDAARDHDDERKERKKLEHDAHRFVR